MVTTSTVLGEQLVRRPRVWQLDAVRGFAVLLMVLDHALLVSGTGFPLRVTVTRVAMPIFMLLAGHLMRPGRLPWRVLWVVALGGILSVLLPFAGVPNVLLVFGVAYVLLCGPRWLFWAAMFVSATLLVNGWSLLVGDGYPLPAVVLLVGLGTFTPRSGWERLGGLLPAWFGWVGRFPLSVYVGHLVALDAVFYLVTGGLR